MDDVSVGWFLVFWYRHGGKTRVRSFADQAKAFAEYIEAEQLHAAATRGPDPSLEIVLIGAESIDSLMEAYPHYFGGDTRDERVERLLDRIAVAASSQKP